MILTTDDLRHALAETANDPYRPGEGSRLDDVSARVRTTRRRRAAAATAASGIAAAAVAASFVLGHGSPRISPTPATSPRPSVITVPAMPALWGVRDVVGQVTGSGWQTPTARLEWPQGTTGVLVRCTGTDRAVQVDVRPATGVASRTTVRCQGADEAWQAADLPPAATGIRSGTEVTVQAQLDAPEAKTSFGAALLVGEDLVDLSRLAMPPAGYDDLGGFALSEGWFYSGMSSAGEPVATADPHVQNGAQLVLGDRRTLHLTVHCFGAAVLELTGEDVEGPATVTCPADVRAVKDLDVPLRRADDQRLALRVRDSAPGALIEVGVSAR
jgi:hypothetical protein